MSSFCVGARAAFAGRVELVGLVGQVEKNASDDSYCLTKRLQPLRSSKSGEVLGVWMSWTRVEPAHPSF